MAWDRRTDALELKIGGLGTNLEREVGRPDRKLDSHFRWIVGIQFAMLIALVASFVAGYPCRRIPAAEQGTAGFCRPSYQS